MNSKRTSKIGVNTNFRGINETLCPFISVYTVMSIRMDCLCPKGRSLLGTLPEIKRGRGCCPLEGR